MSVAKVVAALLILTLISCDPYRTKLASQLTYISAISYETQAAIESWNCNHCSKIKVLQPKVVSNGSVYGFTGYSPDIGSIVVTFRGSVDLSNWILNLKTARTSYPLCTGCSVHIGFNQGFNSVKSQVESNLNSLLALYRTAKVVITGHSLGGALGVMAAAHIQNVYKNVDQLYTMGQPRVGNDKFA
jgi:predicted lipase